MLRQHIFSGTVSFGSDKIYTTTSAPQYLKYPNQTAPGPLHAGMISCSVEDPDGGGGGGGVGCIMGLEKV